MNKETIETYLGSDKDDPIAKIVNQINNACYYSDREIGLYHPDNSSIVKIRNNGMIDSFVSTNVGHRIDPLSKTYNIFSNVFKVHTGSMKAWCEYDINLEVKRTIQANCSRMLINAKELTLNVPAAKLTMSGKTMDGLNKELESLRSRCLYLESRCTSLESTCSSLQSQINSL